MVGKIIKAGKRFSDKTNYLIRNRNGSVIVIVRLCMIILLKIILMDNSAVCVDAVLCKNKLPFCRIIHNRASPKARGAETVFTRRETTR